MKLNRAFAAIGLLLALASSAIAQSGCGGQAGAGKFCGNNTGSTGLPGFVAVPAGSLAPIAGGTVLGNPTGGSAAPIATPNPVLNGSLTVNSAFPLLTLNKAASGQFSRITGSLGTVKRWDVNAGNDDVEAGANSGSNFSIFRFADNGVFLGVPLSIERDNGLVSIPTLAIATAGSTPTIASSLDNSTSIASTAFAQTIRSKTVLYATSFVGCPWDGSGNDDTCVQAALTALAATANGGTLILPMTTKLATKKTWSSGKFLGIEGENRASTIVAAASFPDGRLFDCTSSGTIQFAHIGFNRSDSSSVYVLNANACNVTIDDAYILNMSAGIVTTNSFSGRISNTQVVSTPGSIHHSTTSAHNWYYDRLQCNGSSTSAPALLFDGRTDNITIGPTSSFEGCGTVASYPLGGYGLTARGVYIEGATANEFIFGTAIDNFIWSSSWIALSSGGTTTLSNINSGYFGDNTCFTQTIALGSGVLSNFVIGVNKNAGSCVFPAQSYISAAQFPALTGPVTTPGGSLVTTLANIPTATPMLGSLLATNIAAPSTPASGKTSIFVDSTTKRLNDIADDGSRGTTVVANAGASNNFLTAISAAGVISKAQPSFGNLSGSATCAQLPALTGPVTTTAGTCGTALTSTITAGGPIGSATSIPVITYNAAGQLTAVTTATPTVTAVNGVVYPSSFTSGGIPYASGTGTIASSGVLTANAFVTGGGAGVSPNAVAITGLVKGNGASAPAAYAGTSCTNQFPRSLDLNGAATCASVANTDLTNSAVTVNGTSISLGASGTVTAAAGTLTGTTLNSTVVTSSLTSLGTITSLTATTINAHALGGTISGGGNQINNVVVGASTPLAGSFTALTATTSFTATGLVTNASLANMASAAIKGQTVGGSGAPVDLTATQVGAIIGPAGTPYTPTISCAVGTITTLGTVVGRFQQIGKWTGVYIDIPITINGTCATALQATLPVTAYNTGGARYQLNGGEVGLTSVVVRGDIAISSGTIAYITNASGNYPGGSGARVVLSGYYEAQ
jgi:hypothetical protein